MFNGIYLERNYKKIKMIIDHFGHPFFNGKSVLDLGCGHGDIGAAFYRLGSKVTCVDARNEHVKLAGKKYPGIQTCCIDLDKEWPFEQYDVILDLDLSPHLKNFENHFRNVCNSATYVAFETAVCDSDDPFLCQVLVDNKSTYDHSINGYSSRPTAAMVERIFTECGYEFKRYDYSKLNLGKEIYDWRLANTGTCDINKRRFWVAKKKVNVAIGQNLTLVDNRYLTPGIKLRVGQKYLPPPTLAPKSKFVDVIVPSTNYHVPEVINTDLIRVTSKEFGLIHANKTLPKVSFKDVSGTILPTTLSSRMWFAKIAPFFPNVKLHILARTMFGFNTSDVIEPDLIISSIYNLNKCKRVFIEEWSNYSLTEKNVEQLKLCNTILTPSLLNAQEISKVLPEANIVKVGKTWPLLEKSNNNQKHFLYLEKNPEATQVLLNAWQRIFGKLIVVGSSIKLPHYIDFISDADDYQTLSKLISDSKAVIDISNNTYYMSGLAQLVKDMNVPIITNNTYNSDKGKHIVISQDKTIAPYPKENDIKSAIEKFITSKLLIEEDNNQHNELLSNDLKSLLGV